MRKLFLLFLLSTNVYSFELPNKQLTSGEYDTLLDKKTLCVPNYTAGKDDDGKNVRQVSQKIRNVVFQEYGIRNEDRSKYVIDHLVNLSNGGLNNLYNLWPQPIEEAHEKDRLENKLHKMVCKGEISLKEAQKAIADNWVAAYSKYIEE